MTLEEPTHPFPSIDAKLEDLFWFATGLIGFYPCWELYDHIWVFPKVVVPPKHPKMVIFSRKTQ